MAPALVGVVAARERASATLDSRAFISFTEESGDGPALAVKDNIDVAGIVTTAGTLLPAGTPPAREDAEVVRRFRAAGFTVIGKTNMHEWGLGSSGQNPHFGTVLNPRDPSRLAGGSSGGSAAAVALGVTDVALGTDTGGSIRIPSALCGVVGFRPTFGRVSVEGLKPLAQSLDAIGLIVRDIRLLPGLLPVLGIDEEAGGDERSPEPRLGTPAGWVSGLDSGVSAVWGRIALGLVEVEAPPLEAFVQPALTVLYFEAARNLRAQFEDRRESLGTDLQKLVRDGLEISDREYADARRRQAELREELSRVFDDVDALVMPATRAVAPHVDEGALELREKLTPFARPFALTGHPVVAMPYPVGDARLPVGMQLVGPRGSDRRLAEMAVGVSDSWASAGQRP